MAKTDSTDDEAVDKLDTDVENDESQDEIEKVDTAGDEDTDEQTDETNEESDDDSESEDENSDDDDETEDDTDTSFKKRYTQLKGETLEEYNASLESAYQNSSTEAIRLKHELDALKQKDDKVTALIAQNPELAEKLGGEVDEPELNPALLHAEEQLQKQMQTEYQDFMDKHPDVATDEALQKQMLTQMTTYSDTVRKSQRRQPSMKEALNFAYTSLGGNDSKEEDFRMKAKDTAARGKSAKTTTKKPAKKTDFTDSQIAVGLKMGIGKTKEEVIKKFREQLK